MGTKTKFQWSSRSFGLGSEMTAGVSVLAKVALRGPGCFFVLAFCVGARAKRTCSSCPSRESPGLVE